MQSSALSSQLSLVGLNTHIHGFPGAVLGTRKGTAVLSSQPVPGCLSNKEGRKRSKLLT